MHNKSTLFIFSGKASSRLMLAGYDNLIAHLSMHCICHVVFLDDAIPLISRNTAEKNSDELQKRLKKNLLSLELFEDIKLYHYSEIRIADNNINSADANTNLALASHALSSDAYKALVEHSDIQYHY